MDIIKIVCRKNITDLTVGKIYMATTIPQTNYYFLKDDSEKYEYYFKTFFITLQEHRKEVLSKLLS
jgi:hypothetical protein